MSGLQVETLLHFGVGTYYSVENNHSKENYVEKIERDKELVQIPKRNQKFTISVRPFPLFGLPLHFSQPAFECCSFILFKHVKKFGVKMVGK